MNFAEQLAYWYLRLNGFFPLVNFVMHQMEGERTSDADLIAVRFPHVAEVIGGMPTDWDERFNREWKIELRKQTVALIVEVKSGRWTSDDIMRASHWKSRYALRRIGILPDDQVDEAAERLETSASVSVGGSHFARLVIGSAQAIAHDAPFLFLKLEDTEDFIRSRMEEFKHRKRPDRFFFSGDLIQYLAWSGRGNAPRQ